MYKVVRNHAGHLYSIFACGLARVEYKADEWVEAPGWLVEHGNGLFAFDDFHTALDWMRSLWDREAELWECEAENQMPLPSYLEPYFLQRGKIRQASGKFPESSCCFQRLKLTRRMRAQAR